MQYPKGDTILRIRSRNRYSNNATIMRIYQIHVQSDMDRWICMYLAVSLKNICYELEIISSKLYPFKKRKPCTGQRYLSFDGSKIWDIVRVYF